VKRSLPIIAGALVFAGLGLLVFFLLATRNNDEAEIIAVTTRSLAEKFTKPGFKEGEAFVIEKVFVLKRTETRAIASGGLQFFNKTAIEPHYLELEKQQGRWVVVRDLLAAFYDYMKQGSAQSALSNRLARLLMERFSVTVEIPVGLGFNYALGDENLELFTCDGCGATGPTEEGVTHADPVHDRKLSKASVKEVVAHVATKTFTMGTREGKYFESYRYRDGTWVSDGPGRLMETPQ